MRTHCIADQPTALRPTRESSRYIADEVAMAQKLDIAFWSYDRTRLLADGSVKIEGADVAFHSARIVPEIFEAMIRRRAYGLRTGHDLLPSHLRRGGSLTVSGDSRLPRPRVQARCHLHQ